MDSFKTNLPYHLISYAVNQGYTVTGILVFHRIVRDII